MHFLLITLLLVLSSCSTSPSIDQHIFECIETSHQQKGIPLIEKTLELESDLLDNGTLKAATGDAYYDMLSSIQTIENTPFEWNPSLQNFLDASIEAWSNGCLNELKIADSLAYETSKFRQLEKAFDALEYHDIQTIMQVYLSVLTSNDFEIPLYKAHILLRLADLSRPGIPVDIPE